ncbi:MAG: hypothetical protein KDC44_07340, partial [Phaeodactylibacter sp.]|nr:hypothetical protein [Phaeodactylibacter sp.]
MRSKLLEVLRTLSATESRRLTQFLQSPYFNRRDNLLELWEQLQAFAPDYRHPNLNKSWLFRRVLGTAQPYDERIFNTLSSDFLKLVYEFLITEDHQQQGVLREVRLMHSLLDRDLPRHLPAIQRKVDALQKRLPIQNQLFHYRQYQLQECLDREFLTHQSRGADPHLQHLNDHLDLAYWINKLRIACGMLSRNKVVNAGYQCHFLEPLLHYLESQPALLAANPALRLHYQAYQLLHTEILEEMVGAYAVLKQALQQYQEVLPSDELYAVYNYALNFCIRQINSGESNYYQEVLELYQDMLEHGILLKNEQLNQWTYKNIITAGIRSAQFEWTEAFIHNYKNHLPLEEQSHA